MGAVRRSILSLAVLATLAVVILRCSLGSSTNAAFTGASPAPRLRAGGSSSNIAGVQGVESKIAMNRDPNTAEEWEVTRSARFDDDSTKNPPSALWVGLFLIFFPYIFDFFYKIGDK